MNEIPLTAPRLITAGTTVRFRTYERDYLPPDWVGTLALVTSSTAVRFTSTDNGDDSHLFTISPAESSALDPGAHRYQITLEETATSERHLVRQGVIEVLRDFAAASDGYDGRSHAAVVFDAICAMIERKATHDQSSLAVGGRSLSRYSPAELLEWKGHYAHQMTDDERISRGYAPSGPRKIRFTR